VIEGRLTNRPSTPMIVGLVITGLCLLIVLVLYLIFSGAVTTFVAIVLTVPTGVALVGVLLLLDRLEPEPPLRLLFAFLWGAGVACLFALVINTTGILVFAAAVGMRTGTFFGAVLLAPLVEETLKGSLLLLLLWRRRDEINGPTDGIIYAGMVGIGFALVEDVNYYSEALHESAAALVAVVVLRGIVSPLCHPLFTSMTGLGVTYAANHRGPRGVFAVIGGWIAAMLLHGIWNLSGAFGLLGQLVAYLILLGVIGLLVVVLVRDRRRIVGLIRHYLPLYDHLGIVTPADVAMLATLHSRSAARRWARTRLGAPAARAMADYQLAATELAMLHDHAASRTVDPDRFAARQVALVNLMRVAHAAFAPPARPGIAPGFPAPPWVGAGMQSALGRPVDPPPAGAPQPMPGPPGPPGPVHPGPGPANPWGPPAGPPGDGRPPGL
jgi:RsiW-degrading membrane proteinase PrsW (M82 family)